MKYEVKVYGIDRSKLTGEGLLKLTDNQMKDALFMDIAESHGYVWTLSGFADAYNADDVKETIHIRFI